MPERTSQSFTARRPLFTYVVLSYAFFWLLLILFLVATGLLKINLDSIPAWVMSLVTIAGSWMPTLAAVIVTGRLEGRKGIKNLFRKFVQFKVPARWYLAALIPLGLTFGAAGIYRLAGGAPSGGVSLTPGFWVNLILVTLLTGPTGEEPGWRGFALPRLLARYSPLKAGLILGIIWDFWHLPLWIASGYSPLKMLIYSLSFSVALISLTVLMTWVFRRTSHSLIPMVIMHFTNNLGINLTGPAGLGLGPSIDLLAILAGLYLLAVIVVRAAGGLSTSREQP